MDRTQYFLQKYSELEAVIARYYNMPNDGKSINNVLNLTEFARVKKKLDYCRRVRNLITHNDVAYNYKVIPSDQMIELLEMLVDQIHQIPLCKDFAILTSNIYSCSLDDHVLPAMRVMKENKYTHVPLLCDGKVTGVFSENTLFANLLDNEIINVDKETRFSELSQYLPIDQHITETFNFLSWDSQVFDAKRLFERASENMERIGMIFLTQSGKQAETLLGIITPWDILAKPFLI